MTSHRRAAGESTVGGMSFRRFTLQRDTDISGVSGTGAVANGCVFPDGVAVLRWANPPRSTAVYDSIDELVTIHGHQGATRIRWLDNAAGDLRPVGRVG